MLVIHARSRFTLFPLLSGIMLGALVATPALAQAPKTYTACYVPSSGTVYRIDKPAGTASGSPVACSSSKRGADVEFTWTDGLDAIRLTSTAGGDISGAFGSLTTAKLLGRALSTTPPTAGQVLMWNVATSTWTPTTPASGASAHAALSGLAADDHSQYLLADGARASVNGFAVGGTEGEGSLTATGSGPRLVWYPKKAAFRVGAAVGARWDDENIGQHSVGLGYTPLASGPGSVAIGSSTQATGESALALGNGATASGQGATAIGYSTTASGRLSTTIGYLSVASGLQATAIGHSVVASGFLSTAMGWRAQAGHDGSMAFGDYSSLNNMVASTANNQFVARFAGGYRLRTSGNLSTGCDLPAGSGVFACTSSRSLKSDFLPVDGESLLAKVRDLPIMSWRYTSESDSVRHVGPFAEDFRAAFGLGTDSLSIGVLDEAGVGLAGVKALEARTNALRAEGAALREENAALRARIERIEALLRPVATPRR